jgi:hypothetical protein
MVNGRLFGTLSFGSRTRSFLDPESVDLLSTVCDVMALAFDRRENERARQIRWSQIRLRVHPGAGHPGM